MVASGEMEAAISLGLQESRRDVQSVRREGFGSWAVPRSYEPDGKTIEDEAAHGTVTSHYAAPGGQGDLDQPDRLISPGRVSKSRKSTTRQVTPSPRLASESASRR